MSERESLLEARPRIVYKTLTSDRRSPYQAFKWPVPRGDEPGEWLEVEGKPVLCRNGLHGWKDIDAARAAGPAVYEMEIDGEIVEDNEKVAATRARLLRVVAKVRGELLESGVRLCRTCGEPHNCYAIGDKRRSWADPDDGHYYDGESWEELARRLLAEKATAA